MALRPSGWPDGRKTIAVKSSPDGNFYSAFPDGDRPLDTVPSWDAIPNVAVDRSFAFPQTFPNFALPYLNNGAGAVVSLIDNDLPEVSYDYATDTLTIASDPGADFTDSMQLRATTASGSYDSPGFTIEDAALASGTIYPYAAWPVDAGGFLANDGITNQDARFRIVSYSPNEPSRWDVYNGGAFTFSAAGASGSYSMTYEVDSYDGTAGPVQSTVTVTVQ